MAEYQRWLSDSLTAAMMDTELPPRLPWDKPGRVFPTYGDLARDRQLPADGIPFRLDPQAWERRVRKSPAVRHAERMKLRYVPVARRGVEVAEAAEAAH